MSTGGSGGGGGSGAYHHGNIQYVQPVKVIPHGPPVAAVPIKGGGSVAAASRSGGYGSSSSYGAPVYKAPSTSGSYGAPRPAYQAPKPAYQPPRPTYNANPAISSGYGAPQKPTYNAPPKPTYNAPSSGYGAPQKPTYNAPSKPTYNAPSSGYGAPQSPTSSYGAPTFINSYHSKRDSGQKTLSSTFRHPFQTNFEPSTKRDLSIGDSSHHHGGHHGHHAGGHHAGGHHNTFSHPGGPSNVDLTSGTTFGSSPHQHGSHGAHDAQGHRQPRKDECYCVPTAQCPSHSIMSGGAQDYSFLIDPRTRPDVHIVAAEDDDSINLGEATFENNRARYVLYILYILLRGKQKSLETFSLKNDFP